MLNGINANENSSQKTWHHRTFPERNKIFKKWDQYAKRGKHKP